MKEFGFREDQIKNAFVAVISGQGTNAYKIPIGNDNGDAHCGTHQSNSDVNPFSLEALLDWLCMHLPTEELPKLFTDMDPLVGGDEMLSKVTFNTSQKDMIACCRW